ATRMFGRVTRQKVCSGEAPSVVAASSSLVPISSSTYATSRTVYGKVTNKVAITRPGKENTTLTPAAARMGARAPASPTSNKKARPIITGDTASGRSHRALTRPRPTKRWRTMAIAAQDTTTASAATAIATNRSDVQSAPRAAGDVAAARA